MEYLSLRNKLLALSLVPLTLILSVVLVLFYVNESDSLAADITDFRQELILERKKQLKEAVEIGVGVVNYQRALGDAGNVNQALRDLRFGKAGYFFIYDTEGNSVFHAVQPDMEGQNKMDMADPNGTKIVVGLLNAAQQGDGHVTYFYQKPNTQGLTEKLGFGAMIPNTNLMLGSGAYIDDIDEVTAGYKQIKTEQMHQNLMMFIILTSTLGLLTTAGVMFTAKAMV